MTALFSLKNLNVYDCDRNVLFQVKDFTLNEGEKILITGKSGSGKTTFLHLLSSLVEYFEGEISYKGRDLKKFSEQEKSLYRLNELGLIFQKFNLVDFLTVEENLKLVLGQTIDKKLWESLASKLGLENKLKTQVQLLSEGEKQRVAIMRTLLKQFPVLLADEPTSSLDHVNCHKVMEAILDYSKNKTLIVVSHDERIRVYFNKIIDFKEILG